MLTILDSTNAAWERVTLDEHGPIVVDFARDVSYADCVMWRTQTDYSLLQLWLLKGSGHLRQIELVLIDSTRVRAVDELPVLPEPEPGLPVADVRASFVPDPEWTTYSVMAEHEPFDVLVGPSAIQLDLGGASERCLATEHARFGLDAGGRLTRLELGPFGEGEMATLREQLRRLSETQGRPARGGSGA